MLIKLHAQGEREALFARRPGAPLVAAALDLQAFGLLNEVLGPRLSHLVLDLVSGALATCLEAASTRWQSRLWTTSLGDEHYLFSAPDRGEAEEVVGEIDAAVRHVTETLKESFAPVRVMMYGSPLHCLPPDMHDVLGQCGILAASVSPDAMFDALACLPAGRDVDAHARFLDRAWDGAVSVVPHDLYGPGGKDGRWRLAFPGIRLALGTVTGPQHAQSVDDSLDFILQELGRTMELLRSANAARMRRDMRLGAPAFRCPVAARSSEGAGALPSIRQMEKDIGRDVVSVSGWQLVLVKPTWRLCGNPDRPTEIGSLKELISRTNPGFADRFLAHHHRALADWFSGAPAGGAPSGWFRGVSGRSLLLVALEAGLPNDDITRRLRGFCRSFSFADQITVSRLHALAFAGRGKACLLQAMACAQAYFSLVEWPRDRSRVRLVTFDESEIGPIGRRLDAGRAAALARYEGRALVLNDLALAGVRQQGEGHDSTHRRPGAPAAAVGRYTRRRP